MTSKFIWEIVKKYKFKILIYFVCFMVIHDSVRIFLLPYLLKLVGDQYQLGTLTISLALSIMLGYSLATCVDSIMENILWKFIIYDYCFKIEMDFKYRLFAYAVQHSINYYNNSMAGAISGKINFITTSLDAITDETALLLSGSIMFLIMIAIYYRINLYLGSFLVLWSIVFYTMQYLLSKLIYKYSKNLTTEENILSGNIGDSFVNILNIKSFSRQITERLNVKKQGIKILKLESKFLKINSIVNICFFLIQISLIVFILGFSLNLLLKKEILLGTFLFIGQNIILTTFMLNKIFKSLVKLIPHIAEMKEGFETILQPIDINDNKNAKKLENIEGKIVFKGVRFRY